MYMHGGVMDLIRTLLHHGYYKGYPLLYILAWDLTYTKHLFTPMHARTTQIHICCVALCM